MFESSLTASSKFAVVRTRTSFSSLISQITAPMQIAKISNFILYEYIEIRAVVSRLTKSWMYYVLPSSVLVRESVRVLAILLWWIASGRACAFHSPSSCTSVIGRNMFACCLTGKLPIQFLITFNLKLFLFIIFNKPTKKRLAFKGRK